MKCLGAMFFEEQARIREIYWRVLAQFYADKNYTKISREYSSIKPWLRCRTHTKISHARPIKNRWLSSVIYTYKDKR